MPGAVALAALVRWTNLLALAGVMGGLVTEILVLPRHATGLGDARRRIRKLTAVSLGLLAAAGVADLVVRAQTMTGGGLDATLGALPLVLGRTHFGLIWQFRAWGLVLLAILCTIRSRSARIAGLGTMLGVLFTVALSGHAAHWGDLTPAAFIDWGHAVAASAWGGGLVCSWWCVFRETRGSLVHADLVTAAHRFSRLAAWCVCLIVLSGLANAYIELATIPALWASPYGRVLAVKVALALGTLALGATNRYRVLPALGRPGLPGQGMRQSSDGDAARMLLSRYVAREAILVVAVFGCTAVLGELPPSRHGGGSHDGMVHVMAAD